MSDIKGDYMSDAIAVIIPVYNIGNQLGAFEQCINSVKCQSYDNWKIYIVDDGSTDSTSNILDKMQKDGRIFVRHTSNQGHIYARKEAIDMVSGCKYITFIDADDYFIDSNLFINAIKEMNEYQVDILSFNVCYEKGTWFQEKKRVIYDNNRQMIGGMLTSTITDGNVCGSIYRTEIVKENWVLSDYNNDDYLCKFAILSNASRFVYEPWKGYMYCNVNVASLTHKSIKDNDYLYYKHAKELTDNIKKTYPDLEEEGDYFRYRILIYLAFRLKAERNTNSKIFEQTEKEIKENKNRIKLNSYLKWSDKIKLLVIERNFIYTLYFLYRKVKGLLMWTYSLSHGTE